MKKSIFLKVGAGDLRSKEIIFEKAQKKMFMR